MLKDLDIEHLLGKMAEEKLIKEEYSKNHKDLVYSLTLKGELKGLKLLESDDGVLYFWETGMKCFAKEIPNEYERLIKIAEILRDEMGINLFRVIERNEDKIIGFKIVKKDDLYRKIVKNFDNIPGIADSAGR